MKPIITITPNPALDKSTRVGYINPDQKLRCKEPRYEPGGGGINVSRAIRRLGGESHAFHLSGGPIGEMFCTLLEEEKIQHTKISIQGITRVSFTAMEESTNHQYRFTMPGPEVKGKAWEDLLDAAIRYAESPGFIVASGSLPPGVPVDFYGRLAQKVRNTEHQLIVDTSGEELKAAAEQGVYLLKPNMRELKHLAGEEIESEAQQEDVVQKLLDENKAEVVIVSLGAAGVLLATSEGFERIRAPTVNIQSKIGAGDSMVAGIVLALSQEKTLQEATRYGVAAGASAVATPGTELCRKEKTEQLYKQILSEQ